MELTRITSAKANLMDELAHFGKQSVSVLIPFSSNDPYRRDLIDWVLHWWHWISPNDWEICIGRDDPDHFNRSRARNDAFRQADGDIIILTDGDTISTQPNVLTAVEIATRTHGWVIAHETYYSLYEEYTKEILQEGPNFEIVPKVGRYAWKMHNKSEAGVLVMPREAYETVEGYDERYGEVWGFEDNAFAESLKQRWGAPQRTPGNMYHLWHPRGLDFEDPRIAENERMFEELRAKR